VFRKAHVTDLVPKRVRKPIRRALSRRIPTPELTPAEAEAIWDELMPDLCRLREIVGPALDLWGRA